MKAHVGFRAKARRSRKDAKGEDRIGSPPWRLCVIFAPLRETGAYIPSKFPATGSAPANPNESVSSAPPPELEFLR
jgi:hypothetical protein